MTQQWKPGRRDVLAGHLLGQLEPAPEVALRTRGRDREADPSCMTARYEAGRCAQELCGNWSGDGRVCPCVLLDLEGDERPIAEDDEVWLIPARRHPAPKDRPHLGRCVMSGRVQSNEAIFTEDHDEHDVGWRHQGGRLYSATCHDCGERYEAPDEPEWDGTFTLEQQAFHDRVEANTAALLDAASKDRSSSDQGPTS